MYRRQKAREHRSFLEKLSSQRARHHHSRGASSAPSMPSGSPQGGPGFPMTPLTRSPSEHVGPALRPETGRCHLRQSREMFGRCHPEYRLSPSYFHSFTAFWNSHWTFASSRKHPCFLASLHTPRCRPSGGGFWVIPSSLPVHEVPLQRGLLCLSMPVLCLTSNTVFHI